MSKISDKNDKFLLNYSYLFWGPLFIGTQCIQAENRIIIYSRNGTFVSQKTCLTS